MERIGYTILDLVNKIVSDIEKPLKKKKPDVKTALSIIDCYSKKARKIMELAIEIGFIKNIEVNRFKINSISNDPAARYEDLKEKWIKNSIMKEKKEKLDEKRGKLQKSLREKKSRMFPPLDTYRN